MNEIKVVVTYRPKDSSQVLQQEYDIEAASDPTLTDIITDFASALKDDHQIRMTLDMLKDAQQFEVQGTLKPRAAPADWDKGVRTFTTSKINIIPDPKVAAFWASL